MTPNEWRALCGYAFQQNGVTAYTPDDVALTGFNTQSVEFVVRPVVVLKNVVRLAKLLQGVSAAISAPIHIRSWYRDPTRGADPCMLAELRLARSVRPSARPVPSHALGAAADVWTPKFGPGALAKILLGIPQAPLLGLGVNRSFLHVDVRGALGFSRVRFAFDERKWKGWER